MEGSHETGNMGARVRNIHNCIITRSGYWQRNRHWLMDTNISKDYWAPSSWRYHQRGGYWQRNRHQLMNTTISRDYWASPTGYCLVGVIKLKISSKGRSSCWGLLVRVSAFVDTLRWSWWYSYKIWLELKANTLWLVDWSPSRWRRRQMWWRTRCSSPLLQPCCSTNA